MPLELVPRLQQYLYPQRVQTLCHCRQKKPGSSRQQPPVKLQQVLPPLGIVLRLSPVGCQGVKKILRPQDLFQWTKTAQILQVNPQSCLVAS
jgi:hypothetical protein